MQPREIDTKPQMQKSIDSQRSSNIILSVQVTVLTVQEAHGELVSTSMLCIRGERIFILLPNYRWPDCELRVDCGCPYQEHLPTETLSAIDTTRPEVLNHRRERGTVEAITGTREDFIMGLRGWMRKIWALDTPRDETDIC
ncbi:unnamed protein product [Danaus chrysippus]|uniref:(African queen) hypothetical protein n=1 Tax=Danaus chrysippus TaxID=151541 RepID=A0A8J2VVM6_9NEOP|nr:unnamed protein product [Danaus chrysippus]